MEKHQDKILWAVVASELGHVFCCGLPIIFSAMSLMAGLGVVSAMPAGLVWFHDLMHNYEIPMVLVSGIVLALGWGLWLYARKIDCHDTGCEHEPCAPRKKTASKILIIATALFVVNVSVYFVFHRAMENSTVTQEIHDHQDDHNH